MGTASTVQRVLPPLEGVRRWRQLLFAPVAALAGLFAVGGIGAAYFATSWFMTDPTDIESRVHGVALGAMMLFLAGIGMLVLVRHPHRYPAALWTAAVGLVVGHVAILASLNASLPEAARTNAVINATSIPVPALLALALYPGKRTLLARDAIGSRARLIVAALGVVIAVAVAVPLLSAQLTASGSDPFVGDQPRYAETAASLLVVAVGLVVVAIGVCGWQTVAVLAGIVSASVGLASLLFGTDPGAPSVVSSAALLAAGTAQLALGWTHRRTS